MAPSLAPLQVEKLTEQMAEVLQRLAALESIKVAGGGRSPPVRACGLVLRRKTQYHCCPRKSRDLDALRSADMPYGR